ncbi:UbiA family prenyltransferase [Elioraea rosea]|uniref:UbiA family prenyltransferase n=1 Tax=Elioraea rosea TaxID=2492390 RepID=UPI0011857FDC|nr:UbiA family prenyltransferase [Elioraea rosea]
MHDAPSPAPAPPLAVDLDGTLVQGDTLYELFFACLRRRPLALLLVPLWLLEGKAGLKRRLAEAIDPRGLVLLYHAPVIDWLKREHAAGRRIVLATAADRAVADAVAAELGLFESVLATEAGHNLRGRSKADALVARFGLHGFDYAGNDSHDLAVWAVARRAVVVAPDGAAIISRARAEAREVEHIAVAGFSLRAVLKAMRPHQWAKNVLVFVPLVAAHRFTELPLLLEATAAFLAMGFVASAGYVANDLLDLQADRAHPRKRRRPLASGALAVPHGPLLVGGLLAAGLAIAAAVSAALALWVLFYLCLTFGYSLWLKQKVLIDVFVLAGLYTHRILAGAIATLIAPSFWLLSLSMFFFLSLAMLKRYSELIDLARDAAERGATVRTRGYRAEDTDTLISLGAASGFSAVFVLALYIDSPNVRALYHTPEIFWLWCPLLLYWLSRMWVGARRGVIDDDPLVFALRDRISLLVLGLMVLLAGLAAVIDLRCLLLGRC